MNKAVSSTPYLIFAISLIISALYCRGFINNFAFGGLKIKPPYFYNHGARYAACNRLLAIMGLGSTPFITYLHTLFVTHAGCRKWQPARYTIYAYRPALNHASAQTFWLHQHGGTAMLLRVFSSAKHIRLQTEKKLNITS